MLSGTSHYSRKFISENTLRFDVTVDVDVNQGYSFEHSPSLVE